MRCSCQHKFGDSISSQEFVRSFVTCLSKVSTLPVTLASPQKSPIAPFYKKLFRSIQFQDIINIPSNAFFSGKRIALVDFSGVRLFSSFEHNTSSIVTIDPWAEYSAGKYHADYTLLFRDGLFTSKQSKWGNNLLRSSDMLSLLSHCIKKFV